jgi:fucose 4-O-acetylase-like acetyltransferase
VAISVSRDSRVDALKGLAIVSVVLYHTMGQYLITAPTLALYVREVMYSFMLPLFAFLSGYVLGRPAPFRPRSYFVRRTMGLLVPYLCWEIIYGLLMRREALRGAGAFGVYLFDTLLNPHLEGRMWYLYILWLALMVLGVLRLFGDRTWVLLAAIGVSALWPWWGNFQRLQWILVYVVVGLLVRRYEPLVLPRIKAIGLIGAVLYLPFLLLSHPEERAVARVQSLLGGGVWSGWGPALVHAGSTVTGLAAVAALVAASYFAPTGLEKALALPGRLSLGIYVTHFAVVERWHDPSPWWIPVIVGLALAISMVVTVLLGRWRVSATLLLGERWTPHNAPLGDVHTETI